jgi:hypothetical protein
MRPVCPDFPSLLARCLLAGRMLGTRLGCPVWSDWSRPAIGTPSDLVTQRDSSRPESTARLSPSYRTRKGPCQVSRRYTPVIEVHVRYICALTCQYPVRAGRGGWHRQREGDASLATRRAGAREWHHGTTAPPGRRRGPSCAGRPHDDGIPCRAPPGPGVWLSADGAAHPGLPSALASTRRLALRSSPRIM